MKKILTSKLKSNSGASLMAALLFFIMAATVGSIILAAATASSGRLAGLQRDEQAHYAINSAASMFSEVIKDKKVVIRLTKKSNPSENTLSYIDPDPAKDPYDPTTEALGESEISGLLLPSLVKSINDFSILGYDDDFPKSSSITATSPNVVIRVGGDDDLAVRATATMTPDLDLLVEFTAEKSIGTPNPETVKVRFKPVVDTKEVIYYHDMTNTKGDSTTTDDGDRVTTHVKVHTISWTNPVFE